ncbi:response regulator [Stappia sediminis]|nr:response regulator [Stappia sediminis]
MTHDLFQTEQRVEQANARFHRFDEAARAHRHFGDLRYWLTDLSVSLLTLSERRAEEAYTSLLDDLARIDEFAPQAADTIRKGAQAYKEKAMQAVDAYTAGNRVIGNALLAAARRHSDDVVAVLEEMAERFEREADAARDIAAAEARADYIRALIAVGIICVAGVVTTLLVLRSILRPLARIDRAMAQLTEGHENVELPPAGKDEFGRLANTLRLLRDSQAKRRELEVAAERQRNTVVAAIETIPDGFALYDEHDRLVMVNHRYVEIFPEIADLLTPGRKFEEVVQAQAERLFSGKDADTIQSWVSDAVQRHRAPYGMVEREFANGLWLRIAKRKTADGGTVAVYTDITDLKRRQAELEKARRGAEVANEEKSRFLASMSHELRTPLNAIIGYSEMLIEDARDLEQDGFVTDLEKILGSGRHLLALINDILDLSKIEAGKMELFIERFDLTALLKDVESTVAPLVAKKGNLLSMHVSVDPREIETDKTKLRQNLFNLLSNAAKFTENGEIDLSVMRQRRDDGDWLEFTVADSGIGMSKEQQSKLFQAFVQADASTTRNYGGTGLGLAITRHFTNMLGGTIEVESAPGEGATFRFAIPAVCKLHERQESEPRPVLPGTAPNETVLVIDDEARARKVVSDAVRKAGFAVVEAKGGEEGIAEARRSKPAAIVLDVIMPGMDGWSVLKALKSDKNLCRVPVILATVMQDREMGLAFGAADHLIKPIDPLQLVETLKAVAGDKKQDVLVVDDDPATRELFRRVLLREGWRVREASNGRVGLEQLEAGRPTIMLLDLMMPEMDGFELLREIRTRPDLSDLPVVVVTSKDLSRQELEWLGSHAKEVVKKGAEGRADLIAALKRHVPVAENA